MFGFNAHAQHMKKNIRIVSKFKDIKIFHPLPLPAGNAGIDCEHNMVVDGIYKKNIDSIMLVYILCWEPETKLKSAERIHNYVISSFKKMCILNKSI